MLAEETLERVFGIKVPAKFWNSVNANFSVVRDSFPNAVDAARYLPPASGLDKHAIAVGPSLLFMHGGLLREEQEEGVVLVAALKGAALSDGLYIAVNPDHRSRLAGDQAARIFTDIPLCSHQLGPRMVFDVQPFIQGKIFVAQVQLRNSL